MAYSLSEKNTKLVQEVLHPTGRVTSEMTLEDLGRLLDAAREEGRRSIDMVQFVAFGQEKYGIGFVDALHAALEKSNAVRREGGRS